MEAVRYTILVLSAIALLLWYKAAYSLGSIGYVLPAAFWLVNVITFNLARIVYYSGIPIPTLNNWAIAIQLHGVITLIGLGCLLARRRRWNQ